MFSTLPATDAAEIDLSSPSPRVTTPRSADGNGGCRAAPVESSPEYRMVTATGRLAAQGIPPSLAASRTRRFRREPGDAVGRKSTIPNSDPLRSEDNMKSGFEKGIAAGVLAGAMSMSGVALAAECIAPANPGGGWDFTCRTIGKIMYDIGVVDKPIQVTNMSGGGGGLAFSHIVNDRGEDGELIVAASSATATRLAQNAYAGHTADQVRFLGAIGADPGIIAVAADSPHASLVDLLDAVRADPSSVTFAGGSAAGGFDHLKVLMALGRTGFTDITRVKYIGVDGGADAITQTIGGHTQAMTGDMSEVVGFLKSGDIRVVAVFTDERVPGFEDIPTAKEQGIDIVSVNWRGLYVPKDIADDDYRKWSDGLAKVAASPEWAEAMVANGLAPFTLVGDEFQGWLDGVIGEIEMLSRDIGVIQ